MRSFYTFVGHGKSNSLGGRGNRRWQNCVDQFGVALLSTMSERSSEQASDPHAKDGVNENNDEIENHIPENTPASENKSEDATNTSARAEEEQAQFESDRQVQSNVDLKEEESDNSGQDPPVQETSNAETLSRNVHNDGESKANADAEAFLKESNIDVKERTQEGDIAGTDTSNKEEVSAKKAPIEEQQEATGPEASQETHSRNDTEQVQNAVEESKSATAGDDLNEPEDINSSNNESKFSDRDEEEAKSDIRNEEESVKPVESKTVDQDEDKYVDEDESKIESARKSSREAEDNGTEEEAVKDEAEESKYESSPRSRFSREEGLSSYRSREETKEIEASMEEEYDDADFEGESKVIEDESKSVEIPILKRPNDIEIRDSSESHKKSTSRKDSNTTAKTSIKPSPRSTGSSSSGPKIPKRTSQSGAPKPAKSSVSSSMNSSRSREPSTPMSNGLLATDRSSDRPYDERNMSEIQLELRKEKKLRRSLEDDIKLLKNRLQHLKSEHDSTQRKIAETRTRVQQIREQRSDRMERSQFLQDRKESHASLVVQDTEKNNRLRDEARKKREHAFRQQLVQKKTLTQHYQEQKHRMLAEKKKLEAEWQREKEEKRKERLQQVQRKREEQQRREAEFQRQRQVEKARQLAREAKRVREKEEEVRQLEELERKLIEELRAAHREQQGAYQSLEESLTLPT